jgi:hypothetical protein
LQGTKRRERHLSGIQRRVSRTNKTITECTFIPPDEHESQGNDRVLDSEHGDNCCFKLFTG